MLSTIQDYPLTIRAMFEHGERVHGGSEVVTFDGVTTRRATFAEVARRSRQLAAALLRLGVQPGERVGTFCWNTQEHLEAYFAVPCIGAVLHTLNLRLFPDQIRYIVNHAENRVIIVDGSLLPLLAPLVHQLKSVRHYIVIGSAKGLPGPSHEYEYILTRENSDSALRELDERSAAAMCYTSGTTGNPKGVVYSHRSICLHSMAVISPSAFGLSSLDRSLVAPSMFHANAWGIPHASWWVGADIILPGRFLQAEPLGRLIAMEKPTFSGGVPTIWNDLVRHAEAESVDLSSFRLIIGGGAAVPRSLIERFDKHRVRMVQIWGMTETGPIAVVAHPPYPCSPEEDLDWRAKTGRPLHGLDMRIVDGEKVLPWDGASIGEVEVRGPWVTASYYQDAALEKFHDGWLRTGDVGSIDALGYLQITDRAKDVIKSGGEWVSSVELENHLMAHPEVIEAVVIAVPDERWDERPLACVVVKQGSTTTLRELRDFLADRVVRWWLPERWAIIEEVPKTSVGKFDKKLLRQHFAEGGLRVIVVEK